MKRKIVSTYDEANECSLAHLQPLLVTRALNIHVARRRPTMRQRGVASEASPGVDGQKGLRL
eukprot:2077032-Pyramimonas_sp.AAC.2